MSVTDFTEKLYQGILLRTSENAGLSYWDDQVTTGNVSTSELMEAFLQSAEAIPVRLLLKFYQASFDRAADIDGLLYHLETVQAGADWDAIAQTFLDSGEFAQLESDEVFVDHLYQALLGREGDAEGRSNWLDSLQNGMGRAEVLKAFVFSDESETDDSVAEREADAFLALSGRNGGQPTSDEVIELAELSQEAMVARLTTHEARVVDAYVEGATVFADINGNGEHDAFEPIGITDSSGQVSLPGGVVGDLIAYDGTDIATNLPLTGIYSAPDEAPVITGLTTLVNRLENKGLSQDEAVAKVNQAFGLAPDTAINRFDPVAGIVNSGGQDSGTELGSTELLEVHAASVKVFNTLSMGSATLRGLAEDGVDSNTLTEALLDTMVDKLESDTQLDLSDTEVLGEVMLNAADLLGDQVDKTRLEDSRDQLVQVMADNNANIDEALDKEGTPQQLLSEVIQAQVMAQGIVADSLYDVLATDGDLEVLVTSLTGERLDEAVNDLNTHGEDFGDLFDGVPVEPLDETEPEPPAPRPTPRPPQDTQAPTVDGSTPISAGTGTNDGSYDAADTITITFSEPVKVANLATDASDITVANGHTLGTGATLAATDDTGGYASTFEITLGAGPTVVATDTLTIAAANIEDAAGNQATGDGVFTVPAVIDTLAPTASVTTAAIQPTGNAVVQSTESGTAYLVNNTVTVTDVASITGSGDSNYNEVAITTADTNTNLAATGLADGTYNVYTVDGAGNLSSASTNTVTVDSTAPAVDGSTPIAAGTGTNDGSYDATDTITITFSEPVKVASLAADASGISVNNGHTLGAGATLAATDESGGYAATFEITLGTSPTVTAADMLTIAAANIEDEAGNLAAGDVIFTVPAVTDSLAPTASVTTATIQTSGNAVVQSTETGTAYLVNTTVAVTDVASITGSGDSNYNEVAISTADTNTNLAAAGLTDGTYKVYTVDDAGNLSSASTNTLTIDSTAPTLSSSTPADDAIDIAVDAALSLTFNEDVQVGTGDILIKKVSDNSTVDTIDVTSGQVVFDGSTGVTITPTSDLSSGTEYYLEIPNTAILNSAGIAYAGISGATTLNFKTETVTLTYVDSTNDGGVFSTDLSTGSFIVDINLGGKTYEEAFTGFVNGVATKTLSNFGTDDVIRLHLDDGQIKVSNQAWNQGQALTQDDTSKLTHRHGQGPSVTPTHYDSISYVTSSSTLFMNSRSTAIGAPGYRSVQIQGLASGLTDSNFEFV